MEYLIQCAHADIVRILQYVRLGSSKHTRQLPGPKAHPTVKCSRSWLIRETCAHDTHDVVSYALACDVDGTARRGELRRWQWRRRQRRVAISCLAGRHLLFRRDHGVLKRNRLCRVSEPD